MHVFLLEAAFSYLNETFKSNLKVNYNYRAQQLADEVTEVDAILRALAVERTITSTKTSHFRKLPAMKVLTTRRTGNSRELKCPPEHGIVCYCGSQMEFRRRFFGANIYAIFAIEEQVKCLACNEEFDRSTFELRDHFQNVCETFNPKPMSAAAFAAWQMRPVRNIQELFVDTQ